MITSPLVERILLLLAMTDTQELSCEEVYALLDEVADIQACGEDVAAYYPLVNEHLRVCKECSEDYAALLTMIAMDIGPG